MRCIFAFVHRSLLKWEPQFVCCSEAGGGNLIGLGGVDNRVLGAKRLPARSRTCDPSRHHYDVTDPPPGHPRAASRLGTLFRAARKISILLLHAMAHAEHRLRPIDEGEPGSRSRAPGARW